MTRPLDPSGALDELAAVCDGLLDLSVDELRCATTTPEALPEPARSLLAHEQHMTATLNDFYRTRVGLHVLRVESSAEDYSRLILLVDPATRRVVEFGIARLDLSIMPAEVRREILARSRPLGEILTHHDVHRQVEPKWFYRFDAGSRVLPYFEYNGSCSADPESPAARAVARPPHRNQAWGRVGVIHVNDRPAIRLLEVVTGLK
ncbi:MAG: hypothetical protein C4547_05515 [Phycisphaerales bacterium]|nr:MAG: hypothetical protein C4547_05515 [Phycisphaerales bacterium]